MQDGYICPQLDDIWVKEVLFRVELSGTAKTPLLLRVLSIFVFPPSKFQFKFHPKLGLLSMFLISPLIWVTMKVNVLVINSTLLAMRDHVVFRVFRDSIVSRQTPM